MNRSVLIITPFFAPQSHAAVFRAYKLAKYLPRYGWKPYVVTVDTNYLYNEDPGLLEALPPEVEVHRARYIEPSLRGLRMALGGRDRTFLSLKRQGLIRPDRSPAGKNHSLARKLYSYLLERWLRNPDAYWTWYRPALDVARRLVCQRGIRLVFTSADPYTCHRLGLALQHRGCRWVADLRDPHAYAAETSSPRPAVHKRQREIERTAVFKADAITTASGGIAMIAVDMYAPARPERIRFIPVGVDEDLLPRPGDQPVRAGPYLMFSGEYLPRYGGEFLRILAEALRCREAAAYEHKLLFVGRREVNEPQALPLARSLGIESRIEFTDHVPQPDVYKLLSGAQYAVLPYSRKARWWCLPAKLADYIYFRKPVLAIVPDPSEARTRLMKANLGIFLDGSPQECVEKLRAALTGRLPLPRPNEQECDRYSARRMTEAFIEVFERVLRS